jgi:hypothetical protein
MLLHGVSEDITLLGQFSKSLLGVAADIGLHLGSLALERCHSRVHFVETLLGPICKEVKVALRSHFLVSMKPKWCCPMQLTTISRQASF